MYTIFTQLFSRKEKWKFKYLETYRLQLLSLLAKGAAWAQKMKLTLRSRINLTYAHRYLGYWLWTHGNIKENFTNIHRKWTRVVCSGIYATEHRLKVSSVPVLGQYMNMFRYSCNVKTRICGEIVQPTAFVPRIENPIQWLETMNDRWR